MGISAGIFTSQVGAFQLDIAPQLSHSDDLLIEDHPSLACGRARFRNGKKQQAVPAAPIFQNPFMAPNNFSEIHNNAYQTDTVSVAGPGRSGSREVQTALIDPPSGIAGTLAFNAQGQIISIRTHKISDTQWGNTLLLIDPDTLAVLTSVELPPITVSGGVTFAGGGYFYLDNFGRVVCVTSTQQIRIYNQQNNAFTLSVTYDLTAALNNPNDVLNSVLPDSAGNLWFISGQAIVGYVNPHTGTIYHSSVRDVAGANPNETNTKSFASDENGGVYLVTDYALYRYQVGPDSNPLATWRSTYDRGTRVKPGQNQQGSGTTPTLFNDFAGHEFVAIADNADPAFHVLVFNRISGALVAKQVVFENLPDENSCENSLIAVNHSLIVENNYGNIDVGSTAGAATTIPGLARVDFDPDTGRSWVEWENLCIAIPSIVTALSTKDGLIYTYAKNACGWYFAAVDYQDGKIVARALVPDSGGFASDLANNFYGGLNIGPNNTVYAGVIGGLVAWRPKADRNCRCRH